LQPKTSSIGDEAIGIAKKLIRCSGAFLFKNGNIRMISLWHLL